MRSYFSLNIIARATHPIRAVQKYAYGDCVVYIESKTRPCATNAVLADEPAAFSGSPTRIETTHDQPGMVANPSRGQLNRETKLMSSAFLSSCARVHPPTMRERK